LNLISKKANPKISASCFLLLLSNENNLLDETIMKFYTPTIVYVAKKLNRQQNGHIIAPDTEKGKE
jgi:hypothetical protein